MNFAKFLAKAVFLFFLCFSGQVLGQSQFLEVKGWKLFQNGREFRTIGFNAVELLSLYYRGGDYKATGKSIIKDLSDHNFRLVTIMGSPFTPADFDIFFDLNATAQGLKRAKLAAVLRELVGDCHNANIKLVIVAMWNMENLADLGHHSLHEGVTNFNSEGYFKVEEYVLWLVDLFKDSPDIAIWQLGSEWNLFADLQMPSGVLAGVAAGDLNHPGPLVRDARNNFNSRELADLFNHLFERIRSVDRNHLLTTGTAEPRLGAMHLFKAAIEGWNINWYEHDSLADWEEYVAMLHGGADVISTHYYGLPLPEDADVGWFQDLAKKLNKPVVLTEAGFNPELYLPNYNYQSEEVIENLAKILNKIVTNNFPLTSVWGYFADKNPYQLHFGLTDPALLLIEQANKEIQPISRPARAR